MSCAGLYPPYTFSDRCQLRITHKCLIIAVLEETYLRPGATVDLFSSPTLAARFSPTRLVGGTQFSTWPNEKPGQFTISYAYDNAPTGIYNVTRIVIELGNDP